MEKFLSVVVAILGGGVLFALVTVLPFMLIWNAVMPELFSLRQIGFWQALGLIVICMILFKNVSSSK